MMYYDPTNDTYQEVEGVDGAAFVSLKSGGGAQIVGSATGGSSTTIQDNTKNWPVNKFAGQLVKLTSAAGIEYLRTVISNTANTITVAELCAAVNGTAVLFAGLSYEVTATGEGAAAAAAGNAYDFVVVAGDGANVALSAVLAGTTVTVTLGTGAGGALDDAKNTATLITAAIAALATFTAAVTGATASDPATVADAVDVTGGADAYGGVLGYAYEILGQSVQLTGSTTGKQATATITLAHDVAAHHAGDVVSTAAGAILEFTNLGAAGDLIDILSVRTKYAATGIPTAHIGWKLRLFNAAPTAIADNAAFNVIAADVGKYIRSIPLSALEDVGDNCFGQDDVVNMTAKLVTTSLFGVLTCNAAETPAIDTVITIIIDTAAL